ncbi:MAG: DUF1080 domain-containing protein [Pirellulales bacterium]|nr:DUF1080 domain-containing protein [Pirellulales bacterium]
MILVLAGSPWAQAADKTMGSQVERFDGRGGALPKGWATDGGRWRVADGSLLVDSLDGEAYALMGEPSWENYDLSVSAAFEETKNPSRWLAIVFRAGRPGQAPWSQVSFRRQSSQRRGVEFAVRTGAKNWSVRTYSKTAKDFQLGQARELRVAVRGTTVQVYVDGKPVLENAYCVDRAKGRIGLGVSGCRARFDDFRVERLPDSPRRSTELHPTLVVAHRGFSARAPENTLSAAKEAIRSGATGCEFDVRRCKSGQIVLMHDLTVDRTTNGKGKVTDLTFAQLRKLDAGSWKGRRWKGEPVPTLDEVLAVLRGSGCTPVIEIKVKGISREVVEAVRRAGMMDQAAVIAFDADVVRDVREIEPRLPCSWLSGERPKGATAQRAAKIAADARGSKTNMVDLHYQLLSEEMIAELHRQGLVVWAWTVDDPVVMRALMQWRVDAITTNRPELVLGQLQKAGKTPARLASP